MNINKSYKVLSFLNKSHNIFTRSILSYIGWVGTYAITGSKILANQSHNDFINDNFKIAFRRSGWYLRNGWTNLETIKDDYFDFTESLQSKEINEILNFLDARKKSSKKYIYLTNKLYIIAAQIHSDLNNKINTASRINDFYETGNQLFEDPVIEQTYHTKKKVRTSDFSIVDAHTALTDFSSTIKSQEWGWYLISGTLLGLIREGGFLAHDYDIDLGVHAESTNIQALVKKIREDKRFTLKKVDYHSYITKAENGYTIDHLPALIKIIHKNGINIDIFLHHKEGTKRWHGSIIHKWINSEFDTQKARLLDIDVLIPSNPELYLEENYGDWKTPIKDFECSTGTPNLTVSKNFLSLALFIKKLMITEHAGLVESKRLRNMLIENNVISYNNNKYTLNKII